MWLVRIPECIETCSLRPFHSRDNLFFAECMTLSKQVFILSYPINKNRFPIQQKLVGSILPADSSETERRYDLIDDLTIFFYIGNELIQIRTFGRPQFDI